MQKCPALFLLISAILPAAGSPLQRIHFQQNPNPEVREVLYYAAGLSHQAFFEKNAVQLAAPGAPAVRLLFPGHSTGMRPEPMQPLPGRTSFFLGRDPEKWRAGLPQFEKLIYKNVWPGIDIVLFGRDNALEFDFVLEPFADPGQIRLASGPSGRLRMDAQGQLVLQAGAFSWTIRKPVTYQTASRGRRREVRSRYVIDKSGEAQIRLGSYDRSLALTIDPSIVFSTYLGDSRSSAIHDLVLDRADNIYVAGTYTALPFPGSRLGSGDGLFAAKLSSDGRTLLYSVYLGSGNPFAVANPSIAVDAAGAVFLAGTTNATDLPAVKALQPSFSGGEDTFLLKLNPQGTALDFLTWFGSPGVDRAADLQVDSAGNPILVGYTNHPAFPRQGAQHAQVVAGAANAFAVKLSATGDRLLHSTILGPGVPASSAIDALDSLFVGGVTSLSSGPSIAPTPGAFVAPDLAQENIFVTKLNPDGSERIYSVLLGTAGFDSGGRVAVDPLGNALVLHSGPGPDRTMRTYLTKLNASGSAIVSEYTPHISTNLFALAPSGRLYLAGQGGATTPLLDSLQTSSGPTDASVAAVSPTGVTEYITLFGGEDRDEAVAIAADSQSNAVVAGSTLSTRLPLVHPVQGPPASKPSRNSFVAKIAPCSYRLSTSSASFPLGGGRGSFAVFAAPECAWTAESTAPWLRIAGPSAGAGNGTVAYSADGYPGFDSRSASIFVNGSAIQVTQSGRACTYSLSSDRAALPFSPSTASLTVSLETGAECPWQAGPERVPGLTPWAGISPQSGRGPAVFTISAAPNPDIERTLRFTIAGQPFTLVQASHPNLPRPVFGRHVRTNLGNERAGILQLADLNRDGIPDLLATGIPPLSVRIGKGDGGFLPHNPSLVPGSLSRVERFFVADFNHDANPDVLILSSSNLGVLFGNGKGALAAPVYSPLAPGFQPAAVADVDRDGFPDLLVSNASSFAVQRGLEGGAFGAALPVSPSGHRPAASLLLADFNEDGLPDVLSCSPQQKDIAIFNNLGQARFSSTPVTIPLAFPAACFLSDINRDGLTDIIVARTGPFPLQTYLANRFGSFSPGPISGGTVSGAGSAFSYHMADLDGDGHQDFLVHFIGGKLRSQLSDGSGAFRPTSVLDIGWVDSFVVGDLNRDGLADLVTYSMDPLFSEITSHINTTLPPLPPALSITQFPVNRTTPATTLLGLSINHPSAAARIAEIHITIARTLNSQSGCRFSVSVPNAFLHLPGAEPYPNAPAGGAVILRRPDCRLHVEHTSLVRTSDGIDLVAALDLQSSLGSGSVTYASVRYDNGQSSPWAPVAIQRLPLQSDPYRLQFTPSPGMPSLRRPFTLQFALPFPLPSAEPIRILLNDTLDVASACSLSVNTSSGAITLHDDDGISASPPAGILTPGAEGAISNSRCRLYAPGTRAFLAGSQPEIRFDLEFLPPFTGAKVVYVELPGQSPPGFQPAGILELYQPPASP